MKGIRMAMMTGLRWGDGGLNTLRSEIEMIAKRCKRSMAQVCIKWSIHKGAIPLVGVRRTKHAEDAVAAASNEWDLSAEEIQRLDVAALDRSTLEKPGEARPGCSCSRTEGRATHGPANNAPVLQEALLWPAA
mmetsp:Transcript_31416/g.49187  ORF Transcript_31416/g.49187 Transcript_31416/m.49187 type:complete len:133 (-) Transcript_31416:391-789(-)